MNKMWLAMLLVPYMGFAQNSQESDYSEVEQFFDHEELVAIEDQFEEVLEKEITSCVKPSPIVSEKVKKHYEKEPSYCAYCGSSLISKSENEPAVKEDSTEVAATEQKPLVVEEPSKAVSKSENESAIKEVIASEQKVQIEEPSSAVTKSENESAIKEVAAAEQKQVGSKRSSIGSKSSSHQSKMNKNSNRPRVTQRKNTLKGHTEEASIVEMQPKESHKQEVSEAKKESQIVEDKRVSKNESLDPHRIAGSERKIYSNSSKKSKNASPAVSPKIPSNSKEESKSSLKAERPKVIQRKAVSSIEQDSSKEQAVQQTPKSRRFAERAKKESTVAQATRPLAKKAKAPEKKRAITKKSSQGSQARIRESISSRTEQGQE